MIQPSSDSDPSSVQPAAPTAPLPLREPRRDPPPGLRMIFDITPEWWGAGILGRDLFFGAQAAISNAIATTIPAELPDLMPFLGTVREIRFSVQRVELECIDMRRTTNEKGPDFTIGGDRTMLVFALNKLRSKEQIAKEDVVLTAIHAKEARGNDLFARLEVEGQKQAEAEAKEALPIELKPNEIPIEEPGPSIGARLRRLVDTIEDARAEVARDVHAGYIDSVPQFAEYLLAEIEGSFGGLIGPRRAQSATTIADINRTRSRS